jgi:hypothetical protein
MMESHVRYGTRIVHTSLPNNASLVIYSRDGKLEKATTTNKVEGMMQI